MSGSGGGPSSSGSRLRESAPFLVTAAAVLVLVPALFTFYVVDDAYISFRYAKNLADGQGFVFNAGSPVEGVTNLLWTLVLAGAFETGAIARLGIERFVITAGLGLALAALWRAGCIMRALGVGSRVRLGSLLLVAATTELWLSMTNGLEGALFAFLLVETLYQTLIRRRALLGALVGAACFLTRPEGLLAFPAAAFAAWLPFRAPAGEPVGGQRSGLPLPALLLFAALILAVSGFRYAYFGELVPNSALAKRPDDLVSLLGNLALGQQYLVRTATANLLLTASFVLAPLLLSLAPAGDSRGVQRLVSAVLLVGYGQLAAILIYAGDWMPFSRLLSPYFFLFGVLASLLASAAFGAQRPLRALVIACIAASALAFSSGTLVRPSWLPAPGGWGFAYQDGGEYRKTVPGLVSCLTTKDVIAAEKIGQIGYRMPNLVIHDILGLTDAHIARHATKYYPRFGKTNLEYTLREVKPTLLLMHSGFSYLNGLDPVARRHFDGHYQILRDPADALDVIAVRREHLERMQPCLRPLEAQPPGLAGPLPD